MKGFIFVTGIECSDPTAEGGRRRDQFAETKSSSFSLQLWATMHRRIWPRRTALGVIAAGAMFFRGRGRREDEDPALINFKEKTS